jgi:hypothetical protein
MARNWLLIKVKLLGGMGIGCDPPPGRTFAVGPNVTFEELASAINTTFGRWDLSHLHEFSFEDDRRVGFPDEDEDPPTIDHATLRVASELRPGDRFTYTFDLGAGWEHAGEVLEEPFDPVETFGETVPSPLCLAGWGTLPDQYGRDSEDSED